MPLAYRLLKERSVGQGEGTTRRPRSGTKNKRNEMAKSTHGGGKVEMGGYETTALMRLVGNRGCTGLRRIAREGFKEGRGEESRGSAKARTVVHKTASLLIVDSS